MSLLHEMLRGQRRVATDRLLESHDAGKTLFEVRRPVSLIYRIGIALISLGFAAIMLILLLLNPSGPTDSWLTIARRGFLWLAIGCWSLVAIVALLGLPPFPRKSRRDEK